MSLEPEEKVSVLREHLERALVVRYNVSKGYQHHDMAEEEALRHWLRQLILEDDNQV